MQIRFLRILSLAVAAIGAVLVGGAAISEQIRDSVSLPWTLLSVCLTVILFVFAVLDPRCRRGVGTVSLEVQRDPSIRSYGPNFFHDEWGLFGTRMGSPLLATIRLLLFIEFVLALILSGHADHRVLFLAASSFATVMMLTIMHVGLSAEPAER
jgi:hypothetical protein